MTEARGIMMRRSRSRFSFPLSAALAALFGLAGCVITPEGIEDVEVHLPSIFPPSRFVSSYVQMFLPKSIGTQEFEEHLGGKFKRDVLSKWGTFTTQYADYGLPKQPAKVRVTVTELATRLQAYGAYTNLRPGLLPESNYVKIGIHATLDGDRLIFVHDLYLVVVRVLQPTPADQQRALLINFGRAISNRIPRSITPSAPISFLPQEDRVQASERLDKDDPLGLSILKEGAVSAIYRKDGKEAKVFLAQVEETFLRASVLKRFHDLMAKEGKVEELPLGDQGHAGKLKGQRFLVAQRESVVYGVLGNLDDNQLQELMAIVDRKIKPFVPAQYKDLQKAKEKEEEKRNSFTGNAPGE